ncbi:MAG: CBS domain-containing protein [Clostridia bacterium]|nr:CBS domain-containing protein [Clostridia bacterium]MDD4686141.1 CBS domain-containing protein [Clostridia bacterium]
MIKTDEDNARRFIRAYNTIDHELRVQYNFRRSMSFSEMIRKSVVMNYVVRKYEDKLIDYGRLRNAIIHRANDEYIIAEPHESVVLEMEYIAGLISAPPKVWNTVCKKDVVTVESDMPLKKVIEVIYTSSFSNLPVYKNEGLIGVANGQKILNIIGEQIVGKVDINQFLEQTKIEDVIRKFNDVKYYEVVPMGITIEKALDLFYDNRKLLILILTKTGSMQEVPLGILTTGDIMDMNALLEKF